MKIIMNIKFIVILLVLLFIPSFCVLAKEDYLEITNVRIVEQSGTINIDEFNYNNETISSITFNQLNDFVVLEFEIMNNTNKDYYLQDINYQLEKNNIMIYSPSVSKKISKGNKEYFQVKLTYNEELVNQNIKLDNSHFNLQFTEDYSLINPKTTNSIIIKVLIVLSLILISYYFIKRRKEALIILVICLIPTIVSASEGINIKIDLKDININGRFINYHIILKNDDEIIDNYDLVYGEPITTLPDTEEKTGYTFEGWYDQNNQEINNNYIVTSNLTLNARYTPINYNLVYSLNGGVLSETNPEAYNIEDNIELHNPTKTGYNFAGWIEEGIGTLQTNVTIYPGTTGNKTFIATYTPNPNTNYTIIHRKMNMEGVYEDSEEEHLQGTTDSTIYPQPKQYPGFKTPNAQSITINPDGSSELTYYYERERYNFTLSNRENLVTGTNNGLYYYGTSISITMQEIPGYSILWNDDNTEYSRSFILENNTTLEPTYIPNEDTPYKVIFMQMNLDGITYSVKEETTFYGTTDTYVNVVPNIYEGFETPTIKDILIKGDGTSELIYKYERKKYTLTLENEDKIETTTPSGEYYYGTEIVLTAKIEATDIFVKWNNGVENRELLFNLTNNITLFPIYEINTYELEYTGEEEVITIPQTGYYQLEVWGSSGAYRSETHHGGYGGYSTGVIYLEANEKLYINVGGQGTIPEGNAGYNGGGYGGSYGGAGGAGGATHIATQSGLLSTFENNKSSVIIVAGGGGGFASWSCSTSIGGSGGGQMGTPDDRGGTQTQGGRSSGQTGGKFGRGGFQSNTSHSTPGGGGGWYGGGTDSNICVSGGGSGYIGYTNLKKKHMTCYNCKPSYNEEDYSISSICHSSEPLSDCAKEDAGYARITYLGIDEINSSNKIELASTITLSVNKTQNLISSNHVKEGMTFTSSNEEVATINQNGLITTLSTGMTNITLTYQNQEIVYRLNVI